MIAKCECRCCATHLEFDSNHAGQTVKCPHCGGETKLYLPTLSPLPGKEKPAPPAAATPPLPPPAETLKQIRAQSCYRTQRLLITVEQVLCFIGAGLVLVAGVIAYFASGMAGMGLAGGFAGLLVGGVYLLWAVILAVLAIAGKQAALLLVDIADCQIHQAGKNG